MQLHIVPVIPAKAGIHLAMDTGLRRYDKLGSICVARITPGFRRGHPPYGVTIRASMTSGKGKEISECKIAGVSRSPW